jgi:plastocyanin
VAEVGVTARRAVGRWGATAAWAVIALPAIGASHTITIEGMQFSPAMVTVKRGDQVVWTNKDLVPHTATATAMFDSPTLEPGTSWGMTTTRLGRFEYVCTLHPTMKAVLVVE